MSDQLQSLSELQKSAPMLDFPYFSELALSERFSERHCADLRFVTGKCWLVWNGERWAQDQHKIRATSLVSYFVKETLQEIDARVGAIAPERAASLKSSLSRLRTLDTILTCASRQPLMQIAAEMLDAEDFKLGIPAGVLDLKTGSIRPALREDYITKCTAVNPGGDCPRWRQFLNEVTAGDVELQGYLKRMVGYILTGSVQEHALFFLYGEGGNGKGTFVRALENVLGAEYKTEVPIQALLESASDRHPAEIAKLHGTRLAIANETTKGRRWNESLVKQLTGGDTLTARFMRENFFDFRPHHKLVVLGNHKPAAEANEAFRRRLHLIPFRVKFTVNAHLDGVLTTEAPGILKWAMYGPWHGSQVIVQSQSLAATFIPRTKL